MGIAITSKVVKLMVNGKENTLDVRPNETLADVLRERLGLTGLKVGCENGECGACSVIIDGALNLSCLILATECEGKEILTIEGLADAVTGELHPIQKAFIDNHGFQCGYCTPGVIMATKALLDKNLSVTDEDIREAINGNICRCTGYTSIVKSIEAAAEEMRKK